MEAGSRLAAGRMSACDDARRHGPGRVEDEIVDLRAEERRLAVGLADLHARTPHDVLPLDDVRRVSGDVHHDELLRQVVQQHAPAVEVDPQHAHALREWHIELLDRSRAGDAVAFESHPRLEVAHGGLERRVVGSGIRRLDGGEIAARGKARAQERNPRVARAGLERSPGRNRRRFRACQGRAITRQLALQADVDAVCRLQRLDTLVDVLRGERILDLPLDVAMRERAPEVPLRIEALGIHLPERQVVGEPQQRFRVEDVVLGAQRVRRGRTLQLAPEAGEELEFVVRRVEPVGGAVVEGAAQLCRISRIAPGGPEGAPRVERLDQLLQGDVHAVNRGGLRAHQRLELGGNRHGDRIGERRRRLRQRGRRDGERREEREAEPKRSDICGMRTPGFRKRPWRFPVPSCSRRSSGRPGSTCRCWKRTGRSRARCSRPRRFPRC